MIDWMDGNSVDCKMSKVEILRGFVTERLTAAAQEIFAVVERTVAGYEEEASGFQQEIDRQRRQLDVLLQPRVRLTRAEVEKAGRGELPEEEEKEADGGELLEEEKEEAGGGELPEEEKEEADGGELPEEEKEEAGGGELPEEEKEEAGGGELPEEEEQHRQWPCVKDPGTLGLLYHTEEEEREDEEESPERPVQSASQQRKYLQDPDYQTPSRLLSPSGQSERRKRGRPRKGDLQPHLFLRVCLLEDPQTSLIQRNVSINYQVRKVKCPRGLQEADFLDLLGSCFPQLAGNNKPFDVFTADPSRRLQPLKLKALTPEEIHKSIKSAGNGRSALYIRLKAGEEPQAGEEELHPLQKKDDGIKDSLFTSAMITSDQTQHTRLLSPSDQSEWMKRGRPRKVDLQPHLFLRVCMLEDPRTSVANVSMSCRVQELKCPRGLQEADFLNLLRSSFRQLAGNNKRFDVFTTNTSRRLLPLTLKALTPEEIQKSIKSAGKGKSALYIRLKAGDEPQEELHHLQNEDNTTKESPSTSDMITTTDKTQTHASSHSNSVQRVERNNHSSQQQMETEDDDNGGERLVSEPTNDFLALSSAHSAEDEKQDDSDKVNDRDEDWKPDESGEDSMDSEPEPRSPNTMKKQHIKRSSPKTVIENNVLACKVCGDLYRSNILIKHAWKHVDHPGCLCAVCGEQMGSVEALRAHLKSHQKTHDCPICGKSFISTNGFKGHIGIHTGKRPYKCDICHKAFTRMSALTNHRWVHVEDKPHKCDICHKAFGFKAQVKIHHRIHMTDKSLSCNVCGKSLCDLRSLFRHSLTHPGEMRYGCQLCGKRFKHPATLIEHQKIHIAREKPYLCDICCKAFHTNKSLKIKRPYRCSKCAKVFASKANLNVHMRTHNGERPYQCTACDKAFTQSHCLKTHMKIHQVGENSSSVGFMS